MRFSRSALVLATFATLVSAQITKDTRAGYAAVFGCTCSATALDGLAPPIPGAAMGLAARAPGAQLAWLLIGTRASSSWKVQLSGQSLELWVDPAALLASVPLPVQNGIATCNIPLPNDRRLVGLDLALQAVSYGPLQGFQTSNLLLANLGTSPTFGSMLFAITFSKTIAAKSYLQDAASKPMPIYCNKSGEPRQVTITGTKPAGTGPLEIRKSEKDATGAAVIGKEADIVSVTMTVQPGQCLYLFNADAAAAMKVDWEIAVE